MTLIQTIPPHAAEGPLKALYTRIAGPDGAIDNILCAHSLRPHTLEGHMALYKAVLHHSGNSLPKWLLESVGILVSGINRCDYCFAHHLAGLERLLADQPLRFNAIARVLARAQEPFDAIASVLADAFDPAQLEALHYAARLTREPASIGGDDIARLREAGFDDGAILELNQVAAYFAYANRTVLGLGCATDGEALGLSPGNSQNPDDWSHG